MPPRSPCREGSFGPAAKTTVGRQLLRVGPSGIDSAAESSLVQGPPLPRQHPPRVPHGQLRMAALALGVPSGLASTFLRVGLQLGVSLC